MNENGRVDALLMIEVSHWEQNRDETVIKEAGDW